MNPEATDALVVEGLRRIDAAGTPADRVTKAILRAHPELDGLGRVRVARGIIGVRCFEARLRHLLTAAGLPHTPLFRWAAYRVDVLHEPAEAVALGLRQPGAAAPLARLVAATWPKAPAARLAAQASLPHWIAAAWVEALGVEPARALADALNVPGPITLRAARRAGGRAALAAALEGLGVPTRPGALSPDALVAEDRFDIRGSDLWRDGAFEVQDEGSQVLALAVGAQPGEVVLDLCAGAGGKTLALADHMGGRGVLYAADVDRARLADLRGRVRRRNWGCVRILERPGDDLPRQVDRVLVDAPCSALGTWRRGPDRRWHVHAADIPAFARLQSRLLDEAARCLRPGGRLVYATCTLLDAENRAVTDAFTERHPEFEPAPVATPDLGRPADLDSAATRWTLRPDRHGTDGFYVAAWRLKSRSGAAGRPGPRSAE